MDRQRRESIHRTNQQRRLAYEAALANYQGRMMEWSSLSEIEKSIRHRRAEAKSLLIWTLIAICIGTYFAAEEFFSKKYAGDDVWVYSSIFFICLCVVLLPLSKVLGRILRGGVIGFILCVISYLLLLFVPPYFTTVEPSGTLINAVSIGVGVLGFLAEWAGIYHANATPKPPSPPMMVS